MDDIREMGMQALENRKQAIADGLMGKSIKQIFREELVFWETAIKPWCAGEDYYQVLSDLLAKAGYELSATQIGFNLSVVSNEVGFDRKTKKLDGRKALLRKAKARPQVDEVRTATCSRIDSMPPGNLSTLLEGEFDFIEQSLFPVLKAHGLAKYKFLCEEILRKVGYPDVSIEMVRKNCYRIKKRQKTEGIEAGQYE